MKEYISAAFKAVAEGRKAVNGAYVTLYRIDQYYGGPEEGGWWGTDQTPIESAWYATEELAQEVADKVHVEAERMTKESKDSTMRHWADECNRAEARGEDPSELGEPDGPTKYVVLVEDVKGKFASRGPRHYE